jgi:hypothetical protein
LVGLEEISHGLGVSELGGDAMEWLDRLGDGRTEAFRVTKRFDWFLNGIDFA